MNPKTITWRVWWNDEVLPIRLLRITDQDFSLLAPQHWCNSDHRFHDYYNITCAKVLLGRTEPFNGLQNHGFAGRFSFTTDHLCEKWLFHQNLESWRRSPTNIKVTAFASLRFCQSTTAVPIKFASIYNINVISFDMQLSALLSLLATALAVQAHTTLVSKLFP